MDPDRAFHLDPVLNPASIVDEDLDPASQNDADRDLDPQHWT
jgi:hypothetical protein